MRTLSRNNISSTNIICISCPKGCRVLVSSKGNKIIEIKGNDCSAGRDYVREEFKDPRRILPTTVRIKKANLPLIPVKTSAPIPKGFLKDAMQEIAKIVVEAPVELGDIIVKDFMETGVDLIATRTLESKI